MTWAVVTCTLLIVALRFSPEAHAQDAPANGSNAEKRAPARAGGEAREVAEPAREPGQAAAPTRAVERAPSADGLVAEVRARAEQLGARVGEVLDKGKNAASEALFAAKEEARAILLGAADALDSQRHDAAAPGQSEAQTARRARWQQLKARFSLPGSRPEVAVSEELRDHEYRVARLSRARELAQAARDVEGTQQSHRLLAAEEARHQRRMQELAAGQRAEPKAATAGARRDEQARAPAPAHKTRADERSAPPPAAAPRPRPAGDKAGSVAGAPGPKPRSDDKARTQTAGNRAPPPAVSRPAAKEQGR